MPLSFCSASHTGVRRSNNEDSSCVRPDLGLFVVADGVGGYAAGEVASRAAVDGHRAGGRRDGREERALAVAVRLPAGARRGRQPAELGVPPRQHPDPDRDGGRPRARGDGDDGRGGAVRERHGGRAEAGAGRDDRPRRRQPDLPLPRRPARPPHAAITRGSRSRCGPARSAQREARVHPRRNLLTRALTGGVDPAVDLAWVPVAPGDRLLLCSDGLFGGADRRSDRRESSRGTTTPATSLVHAANLAGGPDNITVILIRL